VALKEIRMTKERDGLPITAVREIKLLSQLRHPNLIELQEVAVGPASNAFFLVFEYADHDLTEILDNKEYRGGRAFNDSDIKTLMFQLLQAVDFLHSRWIIHRDIKVSNMLYNDKNGVMKLADLGLARTFSNFEAEPLTPETVTLWYRSPEILFDADAYGPSADMWSVGCVFGELLLGKPLLPGHTTIEQADLIYELLGPPTDEEWPGHHRLEGYVSPKKVSSSSRQDGSSTHSMLAHTFKHRLDATGLDLLHRLLRYNPKSRITAAEALAHEYFTNGNPCMTPLDKMPSFSNIPRTEPKELLQKDHGTPK
jgi:serine/threonine protein kinase